MLTLTEAAANAVAGDTRAVLSEIDAASASLLRMAADVIDGLRNSGVPAGQTQRVYEAFLDSAGNMLQARERMIDGIGLLEIVRRRSDIAEVDIGCPTPWGCHTSLPARRFTTAVNDMAAVAEASSA